MGKHKVTFEPAGVTVEADEAEYPYGRTGQPGSLLDIALSHGVQFEHACGGVGICGTCHVVVEKGMENLSEADDDECDRLGEVPGSGLHSRLACQAVVHGEVTVRIPDWNRNIVPERPDKS